MLWQREDVAQVVNANAQEKCAAVVSSVLAKAVAAKVTPATVSRTVAAKEVDSF